MPVPQPSPLTGSRHQALVQSGAALPHGNFGMAVSQTWPGYLWQPPRAAISHSASVGSRPPAHLQNCAASTPLMQFMGCVSRPLR